jgi:hypothetical protein
VLDLDKHGRISLSISRAVGFGVPEPRALSNGTCGQEVWSRSSPGTEERSREARMQTIGGSVGFLHEDHIGQGAGEWRGSRNQRLIAHPSTVLNSTRA